jgi:hypothetical protein
MKLFDLVSKIDELDNELTIYALNPWIPLTEVVCATEPENGRVPTELKQLGYTYFLEVFIASEFIEDLSSSSTASAQERCERLILYASKDT